MNPTHHPPTVDDTSAGPCWSDFCIASFCDGIHHVDATGHTWTEPRPDCPVVEVDPTPADILRGAAAYLQLHGWCQGNLYATTDTTGPPALGPAACALGALGMAAFGQRLQDVADDNRPEWRDYQRASNAFDDYLTLSGAKNTIPTPDGESPDTASVGEWNDAPGRTADQVIAALTAAADEWERQHTPTGGDRQ